MPSIRLCRPDLMAIACSARPAAFDQLRLHQPAGVITASSLLPVFARRSTLQRSRSAGSATVRPCRILTGLLLGSGRINALSARA